MDANSSSEASKRSVRYILSSPIAFGSKILVIGLSDGSKTAVNSYPVFFFVTRCYQNIEILSEKFIIMSKVKEKTGCLCRLK